MPKLFSCLNVFKTLKPKARRSALHNILGPMYQKQVSRGGTSNYIPQILLDVITCPCHWYLFPAHMASYGSGHRGAAVFLPGFAISWLQNQVARQSHIPDLTHIKYATAVWSLYSSHHQASTPFPQRTVSWLDASRHPNPHQVKSPANSMAYWLTKAWIG